MTSSGPRLSTGVAGLDELLGGGLIPGTLTVAAGATGIGKTQLGLQFAHAGFAQEGPRGIVFDMTARIDSQSHGEYARRMFDWRLCPFDDNADDGVHAGQEAIFDPARTLGDYLHVFDHQGRRVLRSDLPDDAWLDWQAELAAKLRLSIAFFYANFTRGVRRAVIDGIEPAARASDSIQMELFEYVYHQIIRKESAWVARDLFRERYRANAETVAAHAYDVSQVACLLLYTCHETMLDRLIEAPLTDGDLSGHGQHRDLSWSSARRRSALTRAVHRQAPRQPVQRSDRAVRDRRPWIEINLNVRNATP